MHYSQAHDIEEETNIIKLGNHIMIVQDRINQSEESQYRHPEKD
jgi:hypothetical protein